MKPEPITSKSDYYTRLARGAFGNVFRTWPTQEAWQADGFDGLMGLRYNSPLPRCPFVTAIPADQILVHYHQWIADGWEAGRIIFCEAAPHLHNLLQGEVRRCAPAGLYIDYSTQNGLDMRAAMRDKVGWQHAEGLTAKQILQWGLNEQSYIDIMELLDIWDGHVVEFSAFNILVGELAGRNHVVWEVRSY